MFLKTNHQTPPDMFVREAEGLRALETPDGLHIPQVYLVGETFILMEDLRPAARAHDYWVTFGRQLALLHRQTGGQFGFEQSNYLGSTPQPNPWTRDGYEFFAQHRLLYLADLARNKGLLDERAFRRVELLAGKLSAWIPPQPPSLIHGDLWAGNALTDAHGKPALIDPATHYGWAEAELGMTRLFGGFPEAFYRAYVEARPLEPGWEERLPLYNLYHLLNHLYLFGRGYHDQVMQVLKRYTHS